MPGLIPFFKIYRKHTPPDLVFPFFTQYNWTYHEDVLQTTIVCSCSRVIVLEDVRFVNRSPRMLVLSLVLSNDHLNITCSRVLVCSLMTLIT